MIGRTFETVDDAVVAFLDAGWEQLTNLTFNDGRETTARIVDRMGGGVEIERVGAI
jgi:hypothetical protein